MDMGFDLTLYQNLTMPVFQTILLDPVTEEKLRTIDGAKRLLTSHWHQMAHTVGQLVNVTARMRSVQGPRLFLCGSYVLVNSHEVAVMSGIRAAQLACNSDVFPRNVFGEPSAGFLQFRKLVY